MGAKAEIGLERPDVAIHQSGTYDYTGIVPATSAAGGFECELSSRDVPASRLPMLVGKVRLVGRSPRLIVRDAGLNPRASDDRPGVSRHAFIIRARSMDGARVRSAVFHVESTVVERLAPGDALHLLRHNNGAFGFSVLRAGQLVTAVGPLAGLPLGDGVQVRWPTELREEIAEIFRRRDPIYVAGGLTDAIFPSPLEVRVGDERALVGRLIRIVGEFEVALAAGATGAFGLPTGFGSICRIGAGSRLGATLTARLLMQDDAFEMEE